MLKRQSCKNPRILVLWSHLPYYAFACLRTLAKHVAKTIDVISVGPSPNGLLSDNALNIDTIAADAGVCTASKTVKSILDGKYDVVLVGGWANSFMLSVALAAKTAGMMTICMADTPWKSDSRQLIRVLSMRALVQRLFDAIWIPGERGLPLARALGFPDHRIWSGLYSADQDLFGLGADERLRHFENSRTWPKRFVYVGRLVEPKNISRLVGGYARYRNMSASPWELTLIGDGPLRDSIDRVPGIEVLGWSSPNEVADIMRDSGALVLPSTYEPWGLVVHEATCIGLPVLCSTRVGAGADLVRHGVNGFVFDPFDIAAIASAMQSMSQSDSPWDVARASRCLSRSRSTVLWADTLLSGVTCS